MVEPIYIALLLAVFILGYYTRYVIEAARMAKLKMLVDAAEKELKKLQSDAVMVNALGEYYKTIIQRQKQGGE